MGRPSDAEAHLNAALELFGDDAFGVVNTSLDLAAVLETQGRYAEALEFSLKALELAPDGQPRANAHNAVGWYYAQVGRRREAFVHCEQALRLQQKLGDPDGEAHAWDSVGYAYQGIGDDYMAAVCYEKALAGFRELGDRYYEAIILTHLGSVRQDRSAYVAALAILDDLGHTAAAGVRMTLEDMESSS
jgi:tetratricopeptide (TPR) repeat protein